jgi:hypothetical protein
VPLDSLPRIIVRNSRLRRCKAKTMIQQIRLRMIGLANSDTARATAREAFDRLMGRSPLLGWMRQNHALITDRMNTVRPSWDDIARTLAGLGVRDANGEPPKTETVRRAYHRVASALNAKGQRRRRSKTQMAAAKAAVLSGPAVAAPAPPPLAFSSSPPSAPGTSPLPPPARHAFDPTEGAFDPRPPPKFKPASLK